MRHVASLIIRLYPAGRRAEFGDEMREVCLALTTRRSAWAEGWGLLRGAMHQRGRQLLRVAPSAAALAVGVLFACAVHLFVYWALIPHKAKVLRVLLLCLVASLGFAQPPARQDPATLELAKSIYTRAFTELRRAKSIDDMKKLADSLDSPDWISVDRFGRTILTRQDADRELASVLTLAPERRVTEMDILWAEQDADRLMVLAWMMPHQAELIDAEGKHEAMEATLVRDLFRKTDQGWRRFQHDKLVPNNMVLAVEGVPRIVPLFDESHRVTPNR